jgi:hypothetical protein
VAFVLPAAGPLIASGVKALLQYYEQRKNDQSIGALSSSVGQLYRWENFAWNVVSDVFGAAKGGEAISQGVSHDAGVKVEAIGRYVKDITEHTYDTVLPHSLSWLYGYVESHDLVPIRRRLAADESQIRFLLGWRGQIIAWRKNYVDPNIVAWRTFHQWFDGYPLKSVNELHGWITKPATFGTWAAPAIAAPFVAYLGDKKNEKVRDAFTLVMVDAWQEKPELVWDAVLRWLVTN